jgi:protein-S-isoprenylcysteine O-methyltransferase Ste14
MLNYLELKIPPPIVGSIMALLMWVVSGLGPQLPIGDQTRYGLTGVLVLIGISFDVLGLVAFRAMRTTINPLRPDRTSALVTQGVYRVTRNPMYVGMAFLLLAWGVYLSAWVSLAGVALFVFYITRLQIIPEERVLKQRFGAEFSAYSDRVRRWL